MSKSCNMTNREIFIPLIVMLILVYAGVISRNVSVHFEKNIDKPTSVSHEINFAIPFETEEALIPDNLLINHFNNISENKEISSFFRVGKKSSGYGRNDIKVLILGIIASLLLFFVFNSSYIYREYLECIRSREFIIRYIHNKDGRKG